MSWNPSSDVDVVGYNVYYGTESGIYPFVSYCDQATQTELFGLADGLTYYFVVSAVDSDGNESGLSEEVAYTVPMPVPNILHSQVINDENGQPAYLGISAVNNGVGWWQMDYSTDLQNWIPFTFGYSSDVFVLVPLNDGSEPQKFFRLINY